MYSWVIKQHLKSNVKECFVVSGNTKDVVSTKFNQLCQGQLLSFGQATVHGLLRVTATVVWILQVRNRSYVLLTPSRIEASLWNALGGCSQKHILHSVTEQPTLANTGVAGSWALRACSQGCKQQHLARTLYTLLVCIRQRAKKHSEKRHGTSQALASVKATLTSVLQPTTGLTEQKAFLQNISLLPTVLPVTTAYKSPTAWAEFVLTTSLWSREVQLSPFYRQGTRA